jgi:hydrogenase maturation protein HypF
MSYEGQAAIELEGEADKGVCAAPYDFGMMADENGIVLDWRPLIQGVVADQLAGRRRCDIAAQFHHSLARAATAVCREVRSGSGLERVVLSGGVFQNRLLSEEMVTLLEQDGFMVYTHRLVPPNDGGLALGQAMIAGRSQLCV